MTLIYHMVTRQTERERDRQTERKRVYYFRGQSPSIFTGAEVQGSSLVVREVGALSLFLNCVKSSYMKRERERER